MTHLDGARCSLRPLRLSDSTESIKWRNDPETRRAVLGYRFPITDAMEKAWFDAALADQGGKRVTFAVEDRSDSALIGFVHLANIDWIDRCADFGITIGSKQHRGLGIGTEATSLMLEFAFGKINLRRISLRYIADNQAAARIYSKMGFKIEGCLRAAAFQDGLYCDVVLCGLLREEWNTLISTPG
jgi:RimJ/RimL family protein N-acetyltransferase